MNEFARAESVDIDLRILPFDMREQIQIPLHRKFGMMPALHQNLSAAESKRLFDFLVHLLVSDHVGIIVLLGPVKRAEFAINVANVGVIDIAIDDIGDDLVTTILVGAGL